MGWLKRLFRRGESSPESPREWSPNTIDDLVGGETPLPAGCPQCDATDFNTRQTCELCQLVYDELQTVKAGLKPVKKSKRIKSVKVSDSITTLLQNLDLRLWDDLIKYRQRAMRQGYRQKLCDQIYLGLFLHGGQSTWKLILDVFRNGDPYPPGLPVNSDEMIGFVTESNRFGKNKTLIRSLERSRNARFEYLAHCLVSQSPYVSTLQGELLWTEYFTQLRKTPVDLVAVTSARSTLQNLISIGYPPKRSFYVEGSDGALIDASRQGLTEDATFLTEQGWTAIDERKNFPNYYISEAIVAACKHGHPDVLRVLLSPLELELANGRGPNFYFEPADKDGRPAIEFAANAGHSDCAIQIIQKWGGENTNRFSELKSLAVGCAENMAQRACADVLSNLRPPWDETVWRLKEDFDSSLREGNAEFVTQLLGQSVSLYGERTNTQFALITGLSGDERKAAAELCIPHLIEKIQDNPVYSVKTNLTPLRGHAPKPLVEKLRSVYKQYRSRELTRDRTTPTNAMKKLEGALVNLGDLEPIQYIVQRLFSKCWEYNYYCDELSMLRQLCAVSTLTDELVDLIGNSSSYRVHEHHGGEYYSIDTQTGTQAIKQLAETAEPWVGFMLNLAATTKNGSGYVPRGEAMGDGGNVEVSFDERRKIARMLLAETHRSIEFDPDHWLTS